MITAHNYLTQTMKVSGFTFLRNAQQLNYPFIASIQSLLMLVDELVIALGPSDDHTMEMIQGLADERIRVVRTNWCDNMRNQSYLYGQQKMIAQYNCTGDWAFYLEADEVLHEKDAELIRKAMQKYIDDPAVEALVFDYVHFYGSPAKYVQSPQWYPREVRIIKTSVPSFCPSNLWWEIMDKPGESRFPKAAHTGATVYHYGWLRKPHPANNPMKKPGSGRKLKTNKPDPQTIEATLLRDFEGTHPAVVKNWLYKPDSIDTSALKSLKKPDEPAEGLLNRIQEFFAKASLQEHFDIVK